LWGPCVGDRGEASGGGNEAGLGKEWWATGRRGRRGGSLGWGLWVGQRLLLCLICFDVREMKKGKKMSDFLSFFPARVLRMIKANRLNSYTANLRTLYVRILNLHAKVLICFSHIISLSILYLSLL
jgi:hypothetical protein